MSGILDRSIRRFTTRLFPAVDTGFQSLKLAVTRNKLFCSVSNTLQKSGITDKNSICHFCLGSDEIDVLAKT